MDNKETTDKQIKDLLIHAEEPQISIDFEGIIMKNLPNQRPIKKQMLQCYLRMRLALLMTLMSFFSFMIWMFFHIQYDPKITFFESYDYFSYLLLPVLIWYVLFEVFQKAKRTLVRMELVG
ncbi:MAG: hypothetical protein AAF039_02770 [Bacteroidota bacterium]